MPTDALFEKLRLAERRLTAAEERVSFCRAAATKASAVLGGEFVSRPRDVTVHENAVIRLMEAEQEYVEAERQYSDLRNQVCFLLLCHIITNNPLFCWNIQFFTGNANLRI